MIKFISKSLILLTLVATFQACTTLPKHTGDETPKVHEEHTPDKREQPLGNEKRKY